MKNKQKHVEKPKASKKPESANQMKALVETLQRNQAEFENYKKRVERDKEDFKKTAKKNIILQFLPIIDNFELAIKSFKGDKDNVFKGFELIYSQLVTMLEQEGVKIIATETFDPLLHEPLLQEQGEEDGKILDVLQKGYYLHDKVLRMAKVKISKK